MHHEHWPAEIMRWRKQKTLSLYSGYRRVRYSDMTLISCMKKKSESQLLSRGDLERGSSWNSFGGRWRSALMFACLLEKHCSNITLTAVHVYVWIHENENELFVTAGSIFFSCLIPLFSDPPFCHVNHLVCLWIICKGFGASILHNIKRLKYHQYYCKSSCCNLVLIVQTS